MQQLFADTRTPSRRFLELCGTGCLKGLKGLVRGPVAAAPDATGNEGPNRAGLAGSTSSSPSQSRVISHASFRHCHLPCGPSAPSQPLNTLPPAPPARGPAAPVSRSRPLRASPGERRMADEDAARDPPAKRLRRPILWLERVLIASLARPPSPLRTFSLFLEIPPPLSRNEGRHACPKRTRPLLAPPSTAMEMRDEKEPPRQPWT